MDKVLELANKIKELADEIAKLQTEPTVAPSIWFKTDGTGRVIDIMQVTP